MPRVDDAVFRASGSRWTRLPDRDRVTFFEDFLDDTINMDFWAASAEAGATAAAINVQANGVARLVSGTADDETNELAGELLYKAENTLYFEVRLAVSAITTTAVCVGLSDAKGESNGLIAASLDGTTFTTTASDGVFWLYDTDATVDVWRGIGVKADTDITTKPTGVAPVAATFEKLGIAVNAAGHATWFQNGRPVGSSANAVTATTALCPYIAIQNRAAAASRNLDVDYVLVSAGRA